MERRLCADRTLFVAPVGEEQYIGPAHPLRAIDVDALIVQHLCGPLTIVATLGAGVVYVARSHPLRQFGTAPFLVPLIPALLASACRRWPKSASVC